MTFFYLFQKNIAKCLVIRKNDVILQANFENRGKKVKLQTITTN